MEEIDIHTRRGKWLAKVEEAGNKSRLHSAYLAILGLLCLLGGAALGYVSQSWIIPLWLQFALVFPMPAIGTALLTIFIERYIEKRERHSVELTKLEADAQFFAKEIAELSRWCRWRGPISEVYASRMQNTLEGFFEGAGEIDILTPNLEELVSHSLKSILRNPNVKVRIMSLHPDCSAVYRRFSDIEGSHISFNNRKEFTDSIRSSLNTFHSEAVRSNRSWQVRTYTTYPVILILRADDRFLIGFPLSGERIRDQFHFDLRLTSQRLESIYASPNIDHVDPDLKLGAEIRDDLMRHFNSIWDKADTEPWVDSTQVFREILSLPISKLDPGPLRSMLDQIQAETAAGFIRCICSPSEYARLQSANNSNLSQDNKEILSFVENIINQADLKLIAKKNRIAEKQARDLTQDFVNIIDCCLNASLESLSSHSKADYIRIFSDKLTISLSNGVTKGKFEFENLPSALKEVIRITRDEDMRSWVNALGDCRRWS